MTTVVELLAQTRDLDEDAFVLAHPTPALVVEPFAAARTSDPATRKMTRSFFLANPLLEEPVPDASADDDDGEATQVIHRDQLFAAPEKTFKRSARDFLHPDASVVWLEPATRNQINGILVAGRGFKCDLQFHHQTVSKVHALFHRRQDHWLIEDHDSANGTFLHGAQLPPYERRRLSERAQIRLGRAIQATLFQPETLYRFCKLLRTMGEGA